MKEGDVYVCCLKILCEIPSEQAAAEKLYRIIQVYVHLGVSYEERGSEEKD